MKHIVLLIVTASLMGCQPNEVSTETNSKTELDMKENEVQKIKETVSRLFIATDRSDWEQLKGIFASTVNLDYSSMTGEPASDLAPDEIIAQWSSVLPGFDFTHHQLGNFIVEVQGEEASVFCYGTASHYLKNEEGNIWTVVGTYDFNLKRGGDSWQVTTIRFNYKYQDGNANLIPLAIENVKLK